MGQRGRAEDGSGDGVKDGISGFDGEEEGVACISDGQYVTQMDDARYSARTSVPVHSEVKKKGK